MRIYEAWEIFKLISEDEDYFEGVTLKWHSGNAPYNFEKLSTVESIEWDEHTLEKVAIHPISAFSIAEVTFILEVTERFTSYVPISAISERLAEEIFTEKYEAGELDSEMTANLDGYEVDNIKVAN
jgi:hypothetical protein